MVVLKKIWRRLSCEVASGATPRQIIVLNGLPWEFMLVLDEFHPNDRDHPTQGLGLCLERAH